MRASDDQFSARFNGSTPFRERSAISPSIQAAAPLEDTSSSRRTSSRSQAVLRSKRPRPDPDGTRARAKNIGQLQEQRRFNNAVGKSGGSQYQGIDRNDYRRFFLDSASNVQLSLKQLQANANLKLLDANGKAIATSKKLGKRNEVISRNLEAGIYYIRVYPGKQPRGNPGTRYRLETSATPLPPLPTPQAELRGASFNVLSDSLNAGDATNVEFRIRNSGTDAAGAFTVQFYLSQDATITSSDLALGSYAFTNGLAANRLSEAITQTFSLPGSSNPFWNASGQYYIGMFADSTNTVSEANEVNNVSSGEFTDFDRLQIDTTTSDLQGSFFNTPLSANPGDSITVTFQAENIGTKAVGAFKSGFYLSLDQTIDTTDIPLGEYLFSNGLAANTKSDRLDQSVVLPAADSDIWTTTGTYYVGMVTDYANQIAETNESNNASTNFLADYVDIYVDITVNINTQSIADLKGVFLDSPELLVAGSDVSVQFNVENAGNLAANGFWVDFYLSPDPTINASSAGISGDYLLGYRYISSLPAQNTTGSLFANVSLPAANDPFWKQQGNDTYYVGMIIDSFGTIAESNEANNSNTPTLSIDRDQVSVSGIQAQVDLQGKTFGILEGTTPFLTADRPVNVTYQVQNLGNGSAGASKVKFYLSTNSYFSTLDYFLGEQTINGLAGGSSTGNLTKALNLPARNNPFWEGDQTYYIGMVVDAEGAIAETNEFNNSSIGSGVDYDDSFIGDTQTPKADLRGVVFRTPDTLVAGNTFDASVSVQNSGTGAAGSFKVGFYISRDASIEVSDFYLGESTYGSLAPGSDTALLVERLTLPGADNPFWSGSGTYYVGMIVDYTNTVIETNGANNRNQGQDFDYDIAQVTIPASIQTLTGTLGADTFTFQPRFSRTVVSGNGNVDYGAGLYDVLNLSTISSSSVIFNYANTTGGVVYNPGNGARMFDAMTLSNGSEILFEGIEQIQFADTSINLLADVTPNDPLFSQQWNLHMMAVPSAWRFTKGTSNVLLGIQDTGLGFSPSTALPNIHNDLRDPLYLSNGTVNWATNLQDEYIASGGRTNTSHGTAVQGIIAAETNNGQGISGINWFSPVYNLDVINGLEPGDLSLGNATQEMLNQATANGQNLIINLSLKSDSDLSTFTQLVASSPSNVLFVVAAGNDDSSSLSNPASLARTYGNVMAVGAAWGRQDYFGDSKTPGDRISYDSWWGSNYGSGLTLMGPSEVYTTSAISDFGSIGSIQFDYESQFNGTSAAAPNVAGVASLVWSVNPNLSANEVKTILSQTAFDLGIDGYDTVHGSGFINADAAVRRAIAIGKGYA
jgi:serine protease